MEDRIWKKMRTRLFLAIFYESVKDVKYVKYFRQTLIADTLPADV